MISAIIFQLLLGFFTAQSTSQFNNPPGVDVWCGKAYRATNSSFDPGGRLLPPAPISSTPLLNLHFYPRMNLYLSDQETGSFIVDASLSYTTGHPYSNTTSGPNGSIPFTVLNISIIHTLTSTVLVPWSTIPINSTGNEFIFNLKLLKGNLSTIPITIFGVSPNGQQSYKYQSTTTITILPPRTDTGSIARIDQLHGGIHVKSPLTHNVWKPIFPYSFYTSWDWIVSTLTNTTSPYNLTHFLRSGFNIIHPVPPSGTDPFNATLLEKFLTICDTLELYIMYDLRHTYTNSSSISQQLARLTHHPSLLLYYTADEPDGWTDALNATEISYNHIKEIDPYHPISLCLNCANFHFEPYSKGADIILEDTYPVAVNTSFSTVYNTPCNTTYGDCGCDNCHANDPSYPTYIKNPFKDIITRVTDFGNYQDWLGYSAKKPIWGVPQAFHDGGSFWQRWPTPEEVAVLGMLRIVYGAKGVVGWIFPTADEVRDVSGGLARVVGGKYVTSFILGAPRVMLQVEGGDGLVEAALWKKGDEGVVFVVYLGYEVLDGDVGLDLGFEVLGVEVLWGNKGWNVDGGRVVKSGLTGLEGAILRVWGDW